MLVLDAAGRDLVFLETVGAGQSEIEVIGVADTVVLVLMPGSGDSVQALKAGIMEIPDVIAVNKKDHPAAKTMLNEVRSILCLDQERDWRPPIVLTEALEEEGVDKLWDKIDEHRAHLEANDCSTSGAARTSPAKCSRSHRPGPRPPGAGGRRRSRAAAAAGRGPTPRARPVDGGAGDT